MALHLPGRGGLVSVQELRLAHPPSTKLGQCGEAGPAVLLAVPQQLCRNRPLCSRGPGQVKPGGCSKDCALPSHPHTHLCMNGAVVSKGLSTANIGAGDL